MKQLNGLLLIVLLGGCGREGNDEDLNGSVISLATDGQKVIYLDDNGNAGYFDTSNSTSNVFEVIEPYQLTDFSEGFATQSFVYQNLEKVHIDELSSVGNGKDGTVSIIVGNELYGYDGKIIPSDDSLLDVCGRSDVKRVHQFNNASVCEYSLVENSQSYTIVVDGEEVWSSDISLLRIVEASNGDLYFTNSTDTVYRFNSNAIQVVTAPYVSYGFFTINGQLVSHVHDGYLRYHGNDPDQYEDVEVSSELNYIYDAIVLNGEIYWATHTGLWKGNDPKTPTKLK